MDVENPGELFQVLLNNPASRIAQVSCFIEKIVKKNHVSN